MIRLDALARRREGTGRTDPPENGHIELRTADHEEPTWEVRHPGDRHRRRLDGRTRAILGVAAAAALVVNAGAAWLYWRIAGSEAAEASPDRSVVLALRARSDLSRPLRPGQTGSLTVTVTNDNDVPIRISAVLPTGGVVTADDEHRAAGCQNPEVRLNRDRFVVSWDVSRNTIGAFTLPDALTMPPGTVTACNGATFMIPVRAEGTSR